MPELSIIVPVYKVEKYLPKCIDSILAQTFRDFELILIDDGSPDNCGAISDEYAARDSRIKVIHQANAGVSAARNAGLDIASGTYLGFVDSDDWIEPEMYATMIATAKEKQVDVMVCGHSIYEENGNLQYTKMPTEGIITKNELVSSIYRVPNPLEGVCWNKIFLRKKVKRVRYPLGVPRYEDTIYLLQCFLVCDRGVVLQTPYYNVVERCGSATRSQNIALEYAAISGSYMLYSMHKEMPMNEQLRPLATNKFLDDCLRFAPKIREIGKSTGQSYRFKMLRVKWLMTKTIVIAYIHKVLPTAKLRGYIMGMIKL